ncbi:hypothetical protein IWZ00DRAFT_178261 [Phyllosticta capitalensis]|uniref:Uncharacterized protein n=1 Tax=Phyllosticta capitalensis TaxID=121624 RepID=A0ABR1YZ25_9PEZI
MVASQGPGISSAIVHVPAKIGMPDLDICIIDAAICLGYLPSFNPAAGSTPTKLYRDSPARYLQPCQTALYITDDGGRKTLFAFLTSLFLAHRTSSVPAPAKRSSRHGEPTSPYYIGTPQLSDARRFQCRCRCCCFSCRVSGHYCCLVRGAAVTPHCLPAIAVLHRTLSLSLSLATSSSSSSSPLLPAISTVVAKNPFFTLLSLTVEPP